MTESVVFSMPGQVRARPRRQLGGTVTGLGDLVLQAAVPPDLVQADDRQRQERRHDHEELQDLVVDGGGQTPDGDVRQHHQGGDHEGEVEVPAEQDVDDLGEQEQVDARDQQLRDREAERVDQVRPRAEPLAHELRHRADLGAVVERHHHHAEEEHGRHGADPVVVHRRDAELGTVGRHAHDLDGAEVRGDERQSGHPRGERATGEEEVEAAGDRSASHQADADDEHEVDRHQEVVDPVGVQTELGRCCQYHRASRRQVRTMLRSDARYYCHPDSGSNHRSASTCRGWSPEVPVTSVRTWCAPSRPWASTWWCSTTSPAGTGSSSRTTSRSSPAASSTPTWSLAPSRSTRSPASCTSPASSTPGSRSSARCTRGPRT